MKTRVFHNYFVCGCSFNYSKLAYASIHYKQYVDYFEKYTKLIARFVYNKSINHKTRSYKTKKFCEISGTCALGKVKYIRETEHMHVKH